MMRWSEVVKRLLNKRKFTAQDFSDHLLYFCHTESKRFPKVVIANFDGVRYLTTLVEIQRSGKLYLVPVIEGVPAPTVTDGGLEELSHKCYRIIESFEINEYTLQYVVSDVLELK